MRRMNAISPIAISGMAAASTRLAASAHNVANATTPGFAPARADQVEISGGGTAARVSYGAPPSDANAETASGVDLAEEAVNQLAAGIAFAANAAVLRASRSMSKSLLDVMA
jgi:flagellar hook protein FlgE